MNRLTLLLIVILTGISVSAQEETRLSTINLSVILPSNMDGLSESHLSKLESRIIEVVTNNGISADGYTQNFVIYPKFEIYDEKVSQGGMRNFTVLKCNLSLFIKQLSTNIIFSTFSKSLEGAGYNKSDALNTALGTLDPSAEDMNEFVKKAKAKIVKYYQANCESVNKKAESERSLKNYESALAILLTVPEEAQACYDQSQAKARIIFSELQKSRCDQYLQKARTSMAAANYNEALETLSLIDPSAECGKEARKLINTASSKIDLQRRANWDFLVRAYSDGVALKKAQIKAMNNLAIAWVRSQNSSPTYITVIK